MNLVKYVFHWEKWNFELIGNFAHTKEFLTLGKALSIHLSLDLQILIIKISSQTGKHNRNKKVKTTKSTLFRKWF